MEITLTEKQYLERSDYWKAFRKMCGKPLLGVLLCIVILQLLKDKDLVSLLGGWSDILKVFAWGSGVLGMIQFFIFVGIVVWGLRSIQRQYNGYIDLEKEIKISFGEEGISADLKESGRQFRGLYKDMLIMELDRVFVLNVPLVISRDSKEGKKLREFFMQKNISRGCCKLLSK